MTHPESKAAAAALAVLATTRLVSGEGAQPLTELIAKIKSTDDQIRGPAWQSAGPYGAPAVKPLANLMADSEMEVARAAKRALWKVVRTAGQPGMDNERQAVVAELVPRLEDGPALVRREVLWMLSEIGGDESVGSIAALLADRELHEDARAALERIPGSKSLAALQDGLRTAPEAFKPAIAQSLRVRGDNVSGYPSQKLVPTRPSAGGGAKTL
jgi:HEAT repeat protein